MRDGNFLSIPGWDGPRIKIEIFFHPGIGIGYRGMVDTKLASKFAEKKNSEKSSKMVVWRYLKRERK